MRTKLRMVMLPAVVVMAVTAGCTSNSDGGDEAKGKPAGEVCGAFAAEAPAFAALKAIAGDGNFTSDLSEPDKVLDTLRKASRTEQSGKTRPQGIPSCWLLPAKGGELDLRIDSREALEVPDRDARLEKSVTYFSTGERASSSDSRATVYFKCRMKAPAHEITISGELQQSDENGAPEKGIRAHQVTVVNAAARKVAADLGCQNATKLVNGVPKPAA
ncbi:hypothetical protein ACFYRC_04060 [Streptomyces sp. NPDC005279]|uniref:hypothetical protein n=1 Tax=Streptomyces sp. NPDC005279 TaxID=3364712 RepID=UPI0036B20556